MYGDLRKAGDCQLEVLEFGTPIPYEVILLLFLKTVCLVLTIWRNPKMSSAHSKFNYLITCHYSMKRIRSMFRVNTDIPGVLELVHPNKLLPSKYKLTK